MKNTRKVKILLLVGLVAILNFVTVSCKPEKKETASSRISKDKTSLYTNPLGVEFGDPYILDSGNGTYYIYGTGGGAKDGFATYSSIDLINWKNEGQVYHGNTEDSWNLKSFWAPEVYKVKDKYYLFYSADKKDNPTDELETFSIGVAESDSPKEPFKDLKNEPLFDPGFPIIGWWQKKCTPSITGVPSPPVIKG